MTFTPVLLPRSLKNCHPFRLGTTSFIYPAGYAENVKLLGPYIDAVEVLAFESRWPDSLPSEADIAELVRLGEEHDLCYNIHLPIDVSLCAPDTTSRKKAAEILDRFVQRFAPLNPTAYALHLPCDTTDLTAWGEAACDGIRRLLETGISPRLLAIETLDYPLEQAEPLITEFDLSVCMDMGHLFLYGFDVKDLFEKFQERISLIHLHGVKDGRDHISLNQLPTEQVNTVRKILKHFTGTVSLEVFSYKHLAPSLDFLEKIMDTGNISLI